ncbi:coilin isoform X1 [Rhodamnia argentea]|uniref:Coilin isoform X1 n=1 Tax=Rhodamnia argentea TaxID=178133 RepID=A0A8B8QD03_9MYRT|nr:coilin isoform X1 [Rhodamnia argentea]
MVAERKSSVAIDSPTACPMDGVRVRLSFEDRHILSKSQRKEGLKRSWILLKPQHDTISDLASHVVHTFDLWDSCPNGLVLSMDGYVLPHFESTSILKDKDIVGVKMKQGTSRDTAKLHDAENTLEEIEFVEKHPVQTGLKLLMNEEFEKETGGYESESEEDECGQSHGCLNEKDTSNSNAVSKKRKASKKLKGSKRKKSKLSGVEECPEVPGCVKVDIPVEQERLQKEGATIDKCKSSSGQAEPDKSITPANDVTITPASKSQQQENDQGSEGSTDAPSKPKLPSRSARRKKAKRRWLREMRQIGKKEVEKDEYRPLPYKKQSLGKKIRQLPDKKDSEFSKEHEQQRQSHTFVEKHQPLDHVNENKTNEDIVPIVIRPGHIRFEPLEKDVDQDVQKSQVLLLQTFEWNGITSKKKGQKWGKEKAGSWQRTDNKNLNQESSLVTNVVAELPLTDLGDFDKLPPYGLPPQEGDIVAYRVIELSSSWCPELTSFRVGKISSYHQRSNKTLIVPVAEYALDLENIDKSLYKEDGSLEVDFSSLIDVRIVKHGKLNSAEKGTGGGVEVAAGDQNAKSSGSTDNIGEATPDPSKVNGRVDVWEEISEALSAKKAQLSQQDNWTMKESSGRSSWSFRALRGSALGPTMALLRAQNGV